MKRTAATGSGIAVLLLAGVLFNASKLQAQTQPLDLETQTKILKGFQVAPVPLNMVGKDPTLVGYGSYVVNVMASCNDCHTASAQVEYSNGGNPYMGQKTVVNPAVYMGGGNDFGAFPDPAGPFPHIVSRNLTPDSTGLPEGGNTLQQFITIMRTGVDMDHVHPTCTGAPNGNCIPAPFNGNLLQIMPWPLYANLTDYDLTAIYTYLSTIPCLEGGPGEPANRCGPGVKTMASAGPKNVTITTRQTQLDGTKSTSGDANSLSYQWTIPQGSPSAAILGANTATPTVQFGLVRGTYMFQLTVTDSKGNSASDFATINYEGN